MTGTAREPDVADLHQAFADLTEALHLVGTQFTSIWLPLQLALIAVAAVVAIGLSVLVRRQFDPVALAARWPAYLRLIVRAIAENIGTIIFVALLGAIYAAMRSAAKPSHIHLLGAAVNLAIAWVVIALVTSAIRNQFVNRTVAILAWVIAALAIVGLLGPTATTLDSVGIVIGGLRVTPLLVLKTSALLLIALWAAAAASNFLDKRVRDVPDLTPSIQVLIGKLIRLSLITFSIVTVLSSVGIDFSALALFSGAVGVGLGFGLQKIVSNFVSGIILLADKSIKPGDVISVGESFGWVSQMSARYTSVVTRDGREYLIPNEDFVTQRVINWSYSNDRVRLDVNFGVSYGSDPHVVRRLALEVISDQPRILKEPVPVCHLIAFGDSSLDFILRFWITDPIDGITNIRGTVMLALWDIFKRQGIEIPFPQRDLHVKEPLRVMMGAGAAESR